MNYQIDVKDVVRRALGVHTEDLGLGTIHALENAVHSAYWNGREKGMQIAFAAHADAGAQKL